MEIEKLISIHWEKIDKQKKNCDFFSLCLKKQNKILQDNIVILICATFLNDR